MGKDLRDTFFEIVAHHAEFYDDLVIITNDMDVFALSEFKNNFPNKFINVGVAEQNMINVAAGIASTGKRVVVFGILSFLTTRCYEQIKLNICGMNLPVVIVGIGPGLSFSFDGPTHHGIHDIGIMRQLPELVILNPSDSTTAIKCAEIAMRFKTPTYVRLDKGVYSDNLIDLPNTNDGFIILNKIKQNNIIYTGTLLDRATKLHNILKNNGDEYGLINLFQVQPISKELISIIGKTKRLIIIEESVATSGIFSIICEIIVINGFETKVSRLGVDNLHIFDYGDREWLQNKYGLDIERFIDSK
jgi:transketolase